MWGEQVIGCRFAVTGRSAGVGDPPYRGLNLGGAVGQSPEVVRDNRAMVARALGLPTDHLLFMHQVHGTRIVQVEGPWDGEVPACDGLVTTRPGLALAALSADCACVMLADPRNQVAGVAHAGRKGMDDGVVLRLVEAMRDLGARDLIGRVGPSICPRCYPVPRGMCDEVSSRWPVTRSVSWQGEPSLDVAAGVLAQLHDAGVQIRQVPGCTAEDENLYSYRRDGVTGRFAGLVLLTDEEAA